MNTHSEKINGILDDGIQKYFVDKNSSFVYEILKYAESIGLSTLRKYGNVIKSTNLSGGIHDVTFKLDKNTTEISSSHRIFIDAALILLHNRTVALMPDLVLKVSEKIKKFSIITNKNDQEVVLKCTVIDPVSNENPIIIGIKSKFVMGISFYYNLENSDPIPVIGTINDILSCIPFGDLTNKFIRRYGISSMRFLLNYSSLVSIENFLNTQSHNISIYNADQEEDFSFANILIPLQNVYFGNKIVESYEDGEDSSFGMGGETDESKLSCFVISSADTVVKFADGTIEKKDLAAFILNIKEPVEKNRFNQILEDLRNNVN